MHEPFARPLLDIDASRRSHRSRLIPLMRGLIAAGSLMGALAGCSADVGGPASASPTPAPASVVAPAGVMAANPVASGAPRVCHPADGGFLPDPACSPGDTDPRVTSGNVSSTICRSGYTATVRPPVSVTDPIKRDRMGAYGVSAPLSAYELDHLIPLELGGASTVANLWPEPWADPRGAHRKDDLENVLKRRVCSGAVSLGAAQHAIASNWEAAYRTYVGPLS